MRATPCGHLRKRRAETLADAESDVEFHAKLVMLCNYDLGRMMLESVELGSAATTARALLALEPLCLDGPARTVPIALRDLYVLQVGKGRSLDDHAFEDFMRFHFGMSLSTKLRSVLLLARHHVDKGKFEKRHLEKGEKPRPRKSSPLRRASASTPDPPESSAPDHGSVNWRAPAPPFYRI